MEKLKLKDIINLFNKLQHTNMSMEEILELPIYLGNDDELNGIHNGWYAELIDKKDSENQDIIDMINDNYGATELADKGIFTRLKE